MFTLIITQVNYLRRRNNRKEFLLFFFVESKDYIQKKRRTQISMNESLGVFYFTNKVVNKNLPDNLQVYHLHIQAYLLHLNHRPYHLHHQVNHHI